MKVNNDNKSKKVGFLIHPRDLDDFYKKFPYAKILPDKTLYKLTEYLPPIHVSNITGLYDGDDVSGHVLSIPITAKTILEKRELAQKLIKDAVLKAGKLNIGILSLGGLTASISRGGKDVVDINDVGITTGRAYTVKNITDYIDLIINSFNLPQRKLRIGIVGAAGSIGSGVAIRLEQMGLEHFTLIDLEHKLGKLQNKMNEFKNKTKITATHKLENLRSSHIVVTATSAPEALVRYKDLSKGTFIVDDAQPSDISEEIYKFNSLVVLEAGAVKTPGVQTNINMGLQAKDENYCCLVESLILAHNNHFKNFSVGRLEIDKIAEIESLKSNLKYCPAYPQNKKGYISEQKAANVAKKLHDRIS